MSDGSKQALKPQQLEQLVTQIRMDPALAAKMEFERIEQEMQGKREERNARVKGEEDRKGEGLKHEYKLSEIGLENEGKVRAAKVSAENKANTPPKKLDSDNLHKLVIDSNANPKIRGTVDQLTGRYAGTQDSLAITERAQAYIGANPAMSETEAIRLATREWQERQPAGKPSPGLK